MEALILRRTCQIKSSSKFSSISSLFVQITSLESEEMLDGNHEWFQIKGDFYLVHWPFLKKRGKLNHKYIVGSSFSGKRILLCLKLKYDAHV